MIKIDKSGRQKIHARKIDISIYEGDSDSIILEGILRDERLLDSYRPTGKMYPPGTLHHMIIRMEVRGPKLVIEDIEVEIAEGTVQEIAMHDDDHDEDVDDDFLENLPDDPMRPPAPRDVRAAPAAGRMIQDSANKAGRWFPAPIGSGC